jgi:hypothetical protein
MPREKRLVREMVREAAEALPGPFSNADIGAWVLRRYPGTNKGSLDAHIAICTVNQPSRVRYTENQRPRPADDPRYDFLFRVGKGMRALYEPEVHGAWRIARGADGDLLVCADSDELLPPEPVPTESFVPIRQTQIEAAGRLAAGLTILAGAEGAFALLRRRCPDFSVEACLLKCVAINDLYSTRVYAIARMAAHLAEVMRDPPQDRIELVTAIASLPPARHFSFASKIAHFFVDAKRFPILDSYCEQMLKLHLGRGGWQPAGNRYQAFVENLDRLRKLSGLRASYRGLDRYLWLAGQYRRWRAKPKQAQVNTELRTVFESPPSPVAQEDLDILMPPDV